jgi:hypothetical protein
VEARAGVEPARDRVATGCSPTLLTRQKVVGRRSFELLGTNPSIS